MGEKSKEMLHGTLDLLVLRILSDGPLHGYAIAKRLKALSDEVVKVEQGSLYPALYRMQRRGWLRSSWGRTEQNRRAKKYRLTRAGKQQLAAETERWDEFAAAVANVLRPGGGGT